MRLFSIFSRKKRAEEKRYPESAEFSGTTFGRIAEVAFGDKDPAVRAAAQDAVKQLLPGGVAGFEDIMHKTVEGLRDANNSEKRSLAAMLLVGMGEMAIPYVTPLLEDTDPEMRRLAVRILVRIEQDQNEMTGPRS